MNSFSVLHRYPLKISSFSRRLCRYRRRSSSGSSMCSLIQLTDTKKAAIEAGKGSSLLAWYADHHVVLLPPGHRFPMHKYRATRLMLEDDASLLSHLITRPSPLSSVEELSLAHDMRYIHSILNGELTEKEQRNLGFPWSLELVHRSCAAIGGTVAAMHSVMLGLRRAAANIAGGTHHAFSGHGEGFCVFNDIAVAAHVALETYSNQCNIDKPILVIDLDVHQGNGTAKIFEDDDRVITFSMHGANNYPWRSKMRSNYDIDLEDDTGDDQYLAILFEMLQKIFSAHNPSLIFFQAGVDALREDSLGRLAMTRHVNPGEIVVKSHKCRDTFGYMRPVIDASCERWNRRTGLLHRNNMVYTNCLTRQIPLVITMGGGYSIPAEASITAHADVYRSAALRYSGQGKDWKEIK